MSLQPEEWFQYKIFNTTNSSTISTPVFHLLWHREKAILPVDIDMYFRGNWTLQSPFEYHNNRCSTSIAGYGVTGGDSWRISGEILRQYRPRPRKYLNECMMWWSDRIVGLGSWGIGETGSCTSLLSICSILLIILELLEAQSGLIKLTDRSPLWLFLVRSFYKIISLAK